MTTIYLIAAHLADLWKRYQEEIAKEEQLEADERPARATGLMDDLIARIRALELVLSHYRPENAIDLLILATVHADRAAITERDYLSRPPARDCHRPDRLEADSASLGARAVRGELGNMAAHIRDYLAREAGQLDLGLPGFWRSCPGVIDDRPTSCGSADWDPDAIAGGELMGRLVADRAAAWQEHHAIDCEWLALPQPNDPALVAALELKMRQVLSRADALEEGIAALTPRSESDAKIAAAMLAKEICESRSGHWNEANMELLARGLLDWHAKRAGTSTREVFGSGNIGSLA